MTKGPAKSKDTFNLISDPSFLLMSASIQKYLKTKFFTEINKDTLRLQYYYVHTTIPLVSFISPTRSSVD